MAIADDKETVISVLTKQQKDKLRLVSLRNHRSISKEIAYALELYLEGFDDDGGRKRPEEKRSP